MSIRLCQAARFPAYLHPAVLVGYDLPDIGISLRWVFEAYLEEGIQVIAGIRR